MKQARIVELKPIVSGNRFWYQLVAVGPRAEDGTILRWMTARGRTGDPFHVDPDDQHAAWTELNAWAERNGWTVIS